MLRKKIENKGFFVIPYSNFIYTPVGFARTTNPFDVNDAQYIGFVPGCLLMKST